MSLIRPLGPQDFAAICCHRLRMFAEAGVAEEILTAMGPPFEVWLRTKLEDGSYFGFVAEEEKSVVAGIGLRLIDWPPGPLHPDSDRRGCILNVYVEPEFRGRGLATALKQHAEEEFCRLGVCYAMLHATKVGRPVYEKLAWAATPEMAKALR